MGETPKTLVYCVGGLADRANEERHPFRKLYTYLDDYKETPNGDKTVKRIHSFRQSTIIPYPWRIKPIEKVEPRPNEPDTSAIPLFTDQTAEDLAQQLDHDIQTVSREINSEEIIIIAYSSGSALVRRALLLAKERELEREKLAKIHLLDLKNSTNNRFQRFQVEPWSMRLTAIIHIGGMTMGWEFNSQMPKHYLWLGPIIRPLCPHWFIWQLYRGSKFITDTRIGLNRHPLAETHETFYILGTQDQFLSPRDAVEPGMKDKNPTYLEVTGFDHNTILGKDSGLDRILTKIIDANKSSTKIIDPDKSSRTKIIDELVDDKLARRIPQSDIDDYLDPMDNEPARRMEDVEHVVIVLHGIRDSGFWAKRIAHRIKDIARSNKEPAGTEETPPPGEQEQTRNRADGAIASSSKIKNNRIKVVSLSYGYFSLWDFLRPGGRRQAVEWFQNVYADITALYPNADVSFIGHSNGTYLGTHALQCDYVNYRYLVLAGSVIRCDFWDTKGKEWQWRRKVMRLVNMRGVDDWIVGLLPGGLETIPIVGKWMDLGGLGAYGNSWLTDTEQIKLVGDHGAGIVDKGWDTLAHFVLNQEPTTASLNHQDIFKVVNNNAQLKYNNLFRHIRPFILGLYIYLAIFICFSPLLQLLWTGFFAHFPAYWSPSKMLFAIIGNLKQIKLQHLWETLCQYFQYIWQILTSLFSFSSFGFSLGTNGLAWALLAPLGLLAVIALVLNFIIVLRRRSRTIRKAKQILYSVIVYPMLVFLVLKGIAFLLQDAQTIMALLIILSILSFSLLKRI
ncbi:MAG: hypothetical protein VKL58_05710 [Cyanobacteriota bacterium]|nr:hypothetical protein [Cyanobacteriota bacterium]